MTWTTVSSVLFVLAALVYAGAGLQTLHALRASVAPNVSPVIRAVSTLAALANAAGVVVLLCADSAPRFGVSMALSWAALLSVLIVLAAGVVRRVNGLLCVLLFVAGAAALFPAAFPPGPVAQPWSMSLRLLVLIALTAYGFILIAVVQAILLQVMDRHMKSALALQEETGILAQMPSLIVMERVLFRVIGCAFVCLTIVLALGAAVTYDLHGRIFVFEHRAVLTWLSWLVFAVLLAGRHFLGWRKKTALRCFWSATAFYVLAYFVYRFIIEAILR